MAQDDGKGFFASFFTKNTMIAATGNLSTAYNLTIISFALGIADFVYPETKDVTSTTKSTVSTAALIGAIIGQLTMGYVGDWLGRSRAMGITMALTICGALLSSIDMPYGVSSPGPDITWDQLHGPDGFSPADGNSSAKNDGFPSKTYGDDAMHPAFVWLVVTRVLLGVGVGGVYPLAATVAAEDSSNDKNRGKSVSLVFSTQGIGFVLCPIVILLLCKLNPSSTIQVTNTSGTFDAPHKCLAYYGFEEATPPPSGMWGPDGPQVYTGKCNPGANDFNWRMALAIGALPGLILLPYKVASASKAQDTTTKSTFWKDLGNKAYWPRLIGTAGGWFLFDIVFYGNTLFHSVVTKQVFKGQEPTIENNAVQSLILFAIALPGYWVATYLMDSWGRKNIQMLGFGMMTILYCLLAGLLHGGFKGKPGLLLFIYGLTFFFANFGPNSTTFILPSETYPTHVRATMNGFSAAMGKVGAAIGSSTFKPLSMNLDGGGDAGVAMVILICGVISLLGVIVTYFFVKDYRGKSMEGNSAYSSIDGETTPLVHPSDQRASINASK